MNPILATDSYKPSHPFQMPPGMTAAHSYIEARSKKPGLDHTVFAGMQPFRDRFLNNTRRLILDTIMELKSGRMDVGRGMAIAANMKVLNDSVQVEINAAKVSMTARQAGHDFGKVVGMGQRVIGSDTVTI